MRAFRLALAPLLALCLCAGHARAQDHSVASVIARAKALSVSGDSAKLAEARALWERLAEANNTTAIITLAIMLKEGQGGPADPERALDMLLKAVSLNAGSADASRSVAMMYFEGEAGLSRNPVIAYALLTLTSEMRAVAIDPGVSRRLVRDFQRVHASLSASDRAKALCLPVSYVQAYTLSKGSMARPDGSAASFDPNGRKVKDSVSIPAAREARCG